MTESFGKGIATVGIWGGVAAVAHAAGDMVGFVAIFAAAATIYVWSK